MIGSQTGHRRAWKIEILTATWIGDHVARTSPEGLTFLCPAEPALQSFVEQAPRSFATQGTSHHKTLKHGVTITDRHGEVDHSGAIVSTVFVMLRRTQRWREAEMAPKVHYAWHH